MSETRYPVPRPALAGRSSGRTFLPARLAVTFERSASVDATATIATAGAGHARFDRSAVLDAPSTVAVSGFQKDLLRQVTVVSTSAIASVPQRELLRAAAVDGTAAIASQGGVFVIVERAVSLDATGDVASAGGRIAVGVAGLQATGDIAVDTELVLSRSADLSAFGSVSAAAEGDRFDPSWLKRRKPVKQPDVVTIP